MESSELKRWTFGLLNDEKLPVAMEGGEWVKYEDAATVIQAAERRAIEAEGRLREAIDAGKTLALHTHGRSENREVAEAKEQLERAASAPVEGEAQEQVLDRLDPDEIRALISCVGAAATVEPLRPVEESAREKLRAAFHSTTKDPEEGR